MDYIDAVTTGVLSPHVLPVEDLREILSHIEETFPSTMYPPISSEDSLHFYRYLCTYVLIVDKQFLLLINVPIQDHAQQLEIYEVFNLAIPHRNFSAHYNIQNRYLGIMHDETSAVGISEDQFKTCQKANGQHTASTTCKPTNLDSIQKRCSLQIRKASSISIPISIAPNVWIITSPTAAVTSGNMLICPGEAPRSVIPQTPIHVL